MSLQVEKLEKNMAKLTVEVPAEQFEKALKTSYNKNKSKFNVPGFRRGKAPQALIEKMYGPGILYEDAVDEVLNITYGPAADESGLEIVSRPEISIEQIEKGMPLIYTALVAVKPAVTLGEYKGIEVERAKPEVTDADVEAELKKVQEQNSRLVSVEDRPVQNGDHIILDFDGYMDGVPFAGGKAEDYSLVIGSHSFVDTFEEQLIGKNIGEEAEVNVTFPDEYHAQELAGKPAMFKVKVKEIKEKELPELDDEFAEDVSEFSTLEEYKADVRAKLADAKQKQATTENENNVVDQVVANASMEIPEPMIEQQIRNMIEEYAQQMQGRGLSFDQYLQFTGTTVEQMEEQMRPLAEKRIRNRLVLEEVARQENIQISDEAVEEELKKMAESYKMELDQVKSFMGEEGRKHLIEDMAVQEAIDFLVAEAKLI